MAAKHRRTKGKDWDESSCDSTNDEDNNTTSRLKEISHKRHEKQRKRSKLRTLSSENSDEIFSKSQNMRKPKLSHQNTKKITSIGSDDSDSNSSDCSKEKSRVSKLNLNHLKSSRKMSKNSSESDTGFKQPQHSRKHKAMVEKSKKLNTYGKNIKILNEKKKVNQNHSDTNSSEEFQKLKPKKKRKLLSDLDYFIDYTIVDTPSQSNDESIVVEKKQEIKLKNYIIEEVDKIQNMVEELKIDLKYQSDYLIDKKVNVVRDSKFIAHKIIRIYDSVYDKLRMYRNNFVDSYKTWIDNCSSNSLNNTLIVKNNVSVSKDKNNKIKRKKDCKEINSSDETEINENIKNRDYDINGKKVKKKSLSLSLKKKELDTSSNLEMSDMPISDNTESTFKKNNNSISKVSSASNSKKSDSDSSSSVFTTSLKKSKKKFDDRSFDQSDKPESPAKVSDCDSEIFSNAEDKKRTKRENGVKKNKEKAKEREEGKAITDEEKKKKMKEKENKEMEVEEVEKEENEEEGKKTVDQKKDNENLSASKEDDEENVQSDKSKDTSKDLTTSALRLSMSENEDIFESSSSEIANTPVKSTPSSKKLLRKTLLMSTSKPRKSSSSSRNDGDAGSNKLTISPSEVEESERKALRNLLHDTDDTSSAGEDSESETTTTTNNMHDERVNKKSTYSAPVLAKNPSEDEEEAPKRKSNNLLKKNKQLLMQTKKQNSISSDSSSDSAGGRNRQKLLRQANGDDLPPRYRRRQAFSVQKNRHYKADKKLRMECRVTLERLSQNVLVNYSRALEKSKNYVANKKFHSITNLDGLELKKKSKKNSASDESLTSDNSLIISKSKKKNNSEKKPLVESVEDENDIEDTEKNKILSDVSIEETLNDAENKAKEALLDTCSDSSNENDTMMETDQIEEEKLNNLTANNEENDDTAIEVPDEIENEQNEVENEDEQNEVENEDEQNEIENEDEQNEMEYEEEQNEIENEEEQNEIENEDEQNDKGTWKEDTLLNFQLTDSEVDEEKIKVKKNKDKETYDKSVKEEIVNEANPDNKTLVKKKRKQRKMRVLDSDSDAKIDSSEEESIDSELDAEEEKEEEENKKKKGRKREKSSESDTSSSDKKQKSKRRRIKKVATDSESDDQDSPGKGRKNIRKVLKDKHVADDTKKAAQDEEERLKRIAERQRLFNEMYDARLAGEAKVDKLVLDFDEETKQELVVVDKELVKRLKPHQAKGIKFMWDACFESLKQIQKSDGSGCIIAHCMGLGKTFQVVTLSHTLLSHEETNVRTVMVVCPLSTVLNWVNEFKMWLKHVKNGDDIEIYELTKMKKNIERKYQLESWQKTGGVLIIGYEMFRNLTSTGKKMRKAMQESIMRSLVDPGADLVVCDEGHLLKNEDSALSKAMKLVKTLRRIVLTGTPLQNNLKEYHCMVQFVKPNLLGSKKEFLNRFVNPITNGQFDDSTPYDVKLMKKRAHVLHKMLEGSVQRFDYSVLTPFLPPKQEYVIFVRLTEIQIKMYQYYLDNLARRFGQRNGSLFADFQELQRIWTHPYVLRLNAEKVEKANEKKRFEASDSEGSLKDFIDDESESDSSPSSSSASGSNSDIQSIHSDNEKPVKMTRSTRLNVKDLENVVPIQETAEESAWWSKFVEKEHFEDLRISTKLVLLFGILKESEQIGDKVLVFSQSLYSLTLIEQFLNLIDQEAQNNVESEHLDKHSGSWALGLDYFRLDGSTSAENRSAWCKIFNNPSNNRARLFLISTRAGGLGINLTAANRVIIFDASWNPSHDVQSIFRIYRFGQKKPCYVYRFLAAGTMEEKIYNRQVTKLSLACRVVDEQQIERHYSNNDLAELYQFESYEGKAATLNLPKDRLLAEIFLKYKDAVYNYHEHDSLLENKQEEELDEEERKQAWLEYEEEKQGKRQIINMGMNMGFNQMMMNMNSFPELENIKLLIQKDYPNLPPEHLETVARQAVYDMYRFVDQQAVNQTLNPFGGVPGMPPTNMFGAPMVNQQQAYNPQSQLMNMLSQPQMNYPPVNHMPVYSGRGRPPKHMSMNNPMPNMRAMQPPPMHLQQPQIPVMSNNDEVEILTNQQVLPPPNVDSNAKNMQKE